MSIDKSLRSRAGLTKRRNVLTRAEKLEKLADDGKWDKEKDSVFGLPKVRVARDARRSKSKKGPEAEENKESK